MVRLERVTKRYGAVTALAEADLEVGEGEFVTLLGPSGSGKTTLLNLIAGMVAPSAGRIVIAGRDATETPPERRGLGMVFQNYALMPHMTIFENVAFPLRVRRRPEAEIRKRVGEVLELVQLGHVASRRPRQLSGGQQQRVALARCVVYNPSLILMDEPLGALDRKLREQMQLEIKTLHTALGITILYVTHDQEEALGMSDRIVLLDQARIVQAGSSADLYFRPRSVFAATFLGASNVLQGRIVAPGAASLPSGETIAFAAADVAGPAVTLVVRPENVALLSEAERRDNRVRATMVTSSILGGFVDHHAQLADGTPITARELTRVDRRHPSPGQAVELGWSAADTLALPPESRER